MLLDHTSGFPNWRSFNDDHKLNINYTPGSKFAYSGEGILLAQLVGGDCHREAHQRGDA
jgi:CubicO group peptidase (beta-lactamase class C family)